MAAIPAPDPDAPDPDAKVARGRLVDHFKRAYQIVVGLAVTNACGKLFLDPGDVLGPVGFGPQFWMFATFLVTIVPIFHGGDRSLDIKYFNAPALTPWQRASYVIDVYMLLATAIFFVKVAQALPRLDASGAVPPGAGGIFYRWMGYMLGFDVLVLLLDRVKTLALRQYGADALGAYWGWIAFNVALALVCWLAARGDCADQPWVVHAVFAVALIRTVLDYAVGGRFLFP